MGDAGHIILPSRGSLRSTASPARPVPGRRRGPTAAVLLHRPSGDPLRQNSPSHPAPLRSGPTTTSRGPASGQARLGKERRPRSTPGGRLRWSFPSPGEIPAIFQTSSRGQGGYFLHLETKTMQVSPSRSSLRSHRDGAARRPPLRSLPDESHLPLHQPRHSRSSAAAASPSAALSSNHLFNNSNSSASTLPAAPPATPDPRDATFSASDTYGALGLGGSCGKMTIDGGSLYFICA